MKNRRVIVSVLISLSLLIAVMFFVSVLNLRPIGRFYTEKVLELLQNQRGEGNFSYESIGRTFLNSITVNDVSLEFRDEKPLTAEKIELSVGLLDLIRLSHGRKLPYLRLIVKSAEVSVNQDFINYIADGTATVKPETEDIKSFTDLLSQLSEKGIILVFENSSLFFDAEDYRLIMNSFDLSMVLNENLVFNNLLLTSSEGIFNAPVINENVNFSGFNLVLDDTSTVSFTLSSLHSPEFGGLYSLSAILKIREEDSVSGVLNIKKSDIIYGNCESELSDLTVNLSGSIKDGFLDAEASLPGFKVKYDSVSMIGYESVFDIMISEKSTVNILGSVTSSLIDTGYTSFNTGKIQLDIYPSSESFVSIPVFNCDDLPGDNSLTIRYDGKNTISGNLAVNDSLDSEFNFSTDFKQVEFRAGINGLMPLEYCNLLNRFFPIANNYISEKTELNGHFYLLLDMKGKNPEGKANLNIAGSNLKLGKQVLNCGLGFNSVLSDRIAKIDDLYLTGAGMRISYSGEIDTEYMMPNGSLVLQSSSTGEKLAFLDVLYNSDNSVYSFYGQAPYLSDYAYLTGRINLISKKRFTATSLIKTKLNDYPLNLTFDRDNYEIYLSGSGIDIATNLSEERFFDIKGKLDDTRLHISESVSVGLSCIVDGRFDLMQNSFNIKLNQFGMYVSDYLRFDFDLDITRENVVFSNISFGRDFNKVKFNGTAGFSNFSLKNFINGIFDNFSVYIDLQRQYSGDFVKLNYYDKSFTAEYHLDISTVFSGKAVGTLGKEAFANLKFGSFSFNAQYTSKTLTLFNQSGTVAGIDITDFDVVLDFVSRKLYGIIGISNTLKNEAGDVIQKAGFDFSAKLDSIKASALNIAGLQTRAEFDVLLHDAFIGEEYPIKDSEFRLVIDQDGLLADGSMINGLYRFDDRYIDFTLDRQSNAGFRVKGYLSDNLDLTVNDIYFNGSLLNQFINYPYVLINNGIITGDLLAEGNKSDISFYGMLYSDMIDFSLFWLPNQVLSIKNPSFCVMDHTIEMTPSIMIGNNISESQQFICDMTANIITMHNDLYEANINLVFKEGKAGIWVPLPSLTDEYNITGNATGNISFNYSKKQDEIVLSADVVSDDTVVSMKIPQMPLWAYPSEEDVSILTTRLRILTGKNSQFHYPDVNNPFISLSIAENQEFMIEYDKNTDVTTGSGVLEVKNGRVYYIDNDFSVTEGTVYFSSDNEKGCLKFNFDATAKLREYDSEGKPFDVYLKFNKSDLANLSPLVETSAEISGNELMRIIGNQVISSDAQNSAITSFASMAMRTSDIISTLGLSNTGNNRFSITKSMQKALRFDVFNVRSQILENILIGSIGKINGESDISLISRYFNGTTFYAGKYIGENLFFRGSASLISVEGLSGNKNVGYFMADDLCLNIEFGLDWDISFGTLTLFTQPQELSVFSILDNIGFSITRRVKL